MSNIKRGIVISSMGRGYQVKLEDRVIFCRARGRIFYRGERTIPVVGDNVNVEFIEGKEPIISEVLPRKSLLQRRYVGKSRPQPIAANIDRVLICMATESPPFRPALVDRYLATCEFYNLSCAIIVNKIDIFPGDNIEKFLQEFQNIGYSLYKTSVVEGIGLGQFRELLRGNISVLVGPSGVGKSSLINAVFPEANLEVGEISKVGKGRHTTTVSRMIELGDGYIVDTPGIREFALWDIEPKDLERCFVEFRPYLSQCRFRDCGHDSEPGCAVKDAVVEGVISSRRYQSYLTLYRELIDREGENR